MGSLLLRKLIVTATLTVLGLAGQLLHAENAAPAQQKLQIHDGYYPVYPPTAPATGEQQTLIERGEYLAKMGDCISCHTNVKAGTPAYAGGLPIATPFGTFYSPNITPDKETGIGNWTEKDFIRALKEGRDPKGRNYFPVFPYVYFSKTTEEDARALYAYFMSLPPVNLPNKSLPFPFNVPGARFTLWGWNLLFFFPEGHEFQYEKGRSPEWNRGKYIVDGLGHCSMCHTPLNPFGAPKNRYYLTGGFIDGYWAPNITKYGLESATHEQVADVFKYDKLINNAGRVAGPMAEVNRNSLMYLTDEDRMAVATYLKTVVSEEPLGLPPSNDPPSLDRGKQVYFTACVICHQDGAMSAPLLGSSASWYERLKSSGLTGLYRHAIDGFNFMPVKGACVTCSDNDIISAVDFILNESLTRTQLLDLKSGGAKKYPESGQAVYNAHCAACHNDGKDGAPKIGDKEAWKSLIAKNVDVLIENTVHGKDHPKNGGCNQCTTNEIIEAVKYMVSQSKTDGNYSLW
ncbi:MULTISPECIES: c-type cytochrome [Legionella]|uniref:C-type cytochrome n=1 Tax=Legionella resiliens TaxID=2905958 RepID=A0ABS8X040_9GAMM|nr:c-type cytochrome [Legionella sp. PC1000]MCE0722165.1 c-type cytochrome [Legionella sp. 9fVS26]MCE3531319.1 c-type cytochrome [Legionella sp. 8cVS16]QLZ67332.1 cytochrome c [Legionella sp. PC1000]